MAVHYRHFPSCPPRRGEQDCINKDYSSLARERAEIVLAYDPSYPAQRHASTLLYAGGLNGL
jgi:hypothetical protein